MSGHHGCSQTSQNSNGVRPSSTHYNTEYVNSYPSLLHTTSYNFSGTKTTAEICVGMVKPSRTYPKNPAQHAAGFVFIEKQPEVQPVFVNPLTESRKVIECIPVDGASDEGPSHEEVQFFWTLHHITTPTVVILVSARSSGAFVPEPCRTPEWMPRSSTC